jgi:hypothetical protein
MQKMNLYAFAEPWEEPLGEEKVGGCSRTSEVKSDGFAQDIDGRVYIEGAQDIMSCLEPFIDWNFDTADDKIPEDWAAILNSTSHDISDNDSDGDDHPPVRRAPRIQGDASVIPTLILPLSLLLHLRMPPTKSLTMYLQRCGSNESSRIT